MASDNGCRLPDLLRRFVFSPEDRRYFDRTDTEATFHKVRLLTAASIYFNTLAVDDFGGRLGATRGRGLVEQVIGAAFQTWDIRIRPISPSRQP